MISIATADLQCHYFSLNGLVTDVVLVSRTREKVGGREEGREGGVNERREKVEWGREA